MATAPIDDTGADAGADTNDNEAPQLSEVEQIAHEKGWRPKDEFKGAESEWNDAATFLRKTRTDRDLRREIGELKSSIAGITRAADKQVKREVEQRTREIEQRFADAVEAKDTKGAAEAARDMRSLEAEQRDDRNDDPEKQFQRDNPWYGEDDDATAMAIAKAQIVAKRGGSVTDQLKAAREAVHKAFPDLNPDKGEEAPRPKTLTLNNPSRGGAVRAAGKGFADMPTAARDAANRTWEAMKMRGTAPADRKGFDAQYAKDFFGE